MDLKDRLPKGRYALKISGQGEFSHAYVGMDNRGIHVFTRPTDEGSTMRSIRAFPDALTYVDERSLKVGPRGTMDHNIMDEDFEKYKKIWEASADDSE